MDQNTFDDFVRRSAVLLDRRSLMGGLGGVLLAAGLVPPDAEAKKPGKNKRKNCQQRAKKCRKMLPEFCNDDQACIDDLTKCCKLLANCKSVEQANECCDNSGQCGSGSSALFG